MKNSPYVVTKITPVQTQERQLTDGLMSSDNFVLDMGGGKQASRRTIKRWSAEEDAKLAQLVGSVDYPSSTRIIWTDVAEKFVGRTAKQCRERYTNNLKPGAKKGYWTEEEDNHIMTLQAVFGNQWSKIAALLPGRSENDVKNRWYSKTRTLKRKWDITHDSVVGATSAQGKIRATSKKFLKVGPSKVPPRASKLSDDEVSLCHELLNLHSTLKKPVVKADRETTHDDYLFEHISSMKKIKGMDIQSSAVMSADIDSLATIVAEAAMSMKKRGEAKTNGSTCGGGIKTDTSIPTDIDSLANLVAATARKHEKGKLKMTGSVGSHAALKVPSHALFSDSGSKEGGGRRPPFSDSGSKEGDGHYSHPPQAMVESGGDIDATPWDGGTWPMTRILKPGSNDCLIGRGGGTNHHPGNIKWRLIIEEMKDCYKSSPRSRKPQIAMEIVVIWRALRPPGRFLKLNNDTGLWDDIGDEDGRIKCSQALRERKVSKLRLTSEGTSDKGAARRSLMVGVGAAEVWRRDGVVHVTSMDIVDDSDHVEDVAVVEVVANGVPEEV